MPSSPAVEDATVGGRRNRTMKDWAPIVAEFEEMARWIRTLADQRGDDELRRLATRLSQRAADIRRDGFVDSEGRLGR